MIKFLIRGAEDGGGIIELTSQVRRRRRLILSKKLKGQGQLSIYLFIKFFVLFPYNVWVTHTEIATFIGGSMEYYRCERKTTECRVKM